MPVITITAVHFLNSKTGPGHAFISFNNEVGENRAMSRSVLNEARQRLRICMLRDLAFAVH
jgi:hypothetical protein